MAKKAYVPPQQPTTTAVSETSVTQEESTETSSVDVAKLDETSVNEAGEKDVIEGLDGLSEETPPPQGDVNEPTPPPSPDLSGETGLDVVNTSGSSDELDDPTLVEGDDVPNTTTSIDNAAKLREDAIRLEAQNKYGRGVIGWPLSDCQAYLDNKILPPMTARQNWVRDVNRLNDLQQWTLGECLDFIEGKLDLGKGADETLVWEEIYRRFKIPGNAAKQDAVAFVLENTPIPLTSTGQLVNDSTRDAKPVEYWTYLDIRSALLGEITSPHDTPTLVKALRLILGVSDTYSEERLISTLTTERYASMKDEVLLSKLEEFKTARMTKGNFVNPKLHGDAHAMFFRTVKKLFSREYREFKEGWTLLLDFVKREENTLFNIKRRYEHWAMVSLRGEELRAAEDLINLLTMSADPVVRNKGVSEAMIRGLTRHLCTDDEMQKLFTYYAIQ